MLLFLVQPHTDLKTYYFHGEEKSGFGIRVRAPRFNICVCCYDLSLKKTVNEPIDIWIYNDWQFWTLQNDDTPVSPTPFPQVFHLVSSCLNSHLKNIVPPFSII